MKKLLLTIIIIIITSLFSCSVLEDDVYEDSTYDIYVTVYDIETDEIIKYEYYYETIEDEDGFDNRIIYENNYNPITFKIQYPDIYYADCTIRFRYESY